MGIVLAPIICIVIYVSSFKDDFDDETVQKVGSSLFGAIVIIGILTIAIGVLGRN